MQVATMNKVLIPRILSEPKASHAQYLAELVRLNPTRFNADGSMKRARR